MSLSPGIPQAVIATPAVGVLLRLGVACALALPGSDVLISGVTTLGAAQVTALDASLPVNTQGGSCALVNARRMELIELLAATRLGSLAPGARVLGDASCAVSASSPLVTAVGVAVLVDGTRSAADGLAASLGAVLGSPETRNATFRAFLDAAANASGVPTGCFSTAALQSAPAVSIADASLRPGAGGSNQGPSSSSGGASSIVIGGAIAGAVAALCCCAVLAVLVALRFRRQKSPVRVAGGKGDADKGVASPGGSLRYLVQSNPLRDAAAAPKPAVVAGGSARVPDASGATTPKRSPAPPLRKERSIWRLTAPFMAHTAATATLPSSRVHVPPPRVLAADLESPPHADAEQPPTVVSNPLHAREAVGGATASSVAAAASGEGGRGGGPSPRLLSSALSGAPEGSSSGSGSSGGSRARGPSDPLVVSNNPLHAGGGAAARTGAARASMVPPALRGALLPGRGGDDAPGADVKRHEGGGLGVVVSGVNPLHAAAAAAAAAAAPAMAAARRVLRHVDADVGGGGGDAGDVFGANPLHAASAAPATTVTRRVLRHVDADGGGGSGDAADSGAPGTPADHPLWPHRSTAAARRVLLPQFERELQRHEPGGTPQTPDPATLDATVVGSTPGTGFRGTNPLRQGRASMAPVAAGGSNAETASAARIRSTAQPLLAPMTTRRPGARNLKVAAAAAPPGAEAETPAMVTTETLIAVRARGGTSRHAEVV